MGCSPIDKLQNEHHFSDTCEESYTLFYKHLIRKGNLLEVSGPLKTTMRKLYSSYYKNPDCWSSTLRESTIIEMFGAPHSRSFNDRNQKSALVYYIRTEECMDLNKITRYDDLCGVLRFILTKEGVLNQTLFYAMRPAQTDT